jgi:uncharacterized membrane protein (UPF0136 family)
MTSTTTRTRPPAATAVGVLAVVGVVGAIVMTLAHLGLDLGFIRAVALPPVAAGFAVGAVLFAAVAYGAFRRTSWSWPFALVVNALGFVSAVFPWRGVEAVVPAAVTLAALAVLLSRPGREALLVRRAEQG